MNTPASPHFTPVDLAGSFNHDRALLQKGLLSPQDIGLGFGLSKFQGMPFLLGEANRPNVILLDQTAVTIALPDVLATYVLIAHTVEDRITNYQTGFADYQSDGNELGQHVSDYALEYADGSVINTPVLRRFAIQQSRIGWGASAFEAMPALQPDVFRTTSEDQVLGRMPAQLWGRGETRHSSSREQPGDLLWIYALPNPHPDKPIRALVCTPRQERSAIYAVSTTQLLEHPLRPGLRRKLRLTLPEGATLNALGEFDGLAIDMGSVISARAVLAYDPARWLSAEPVVLPTPSTREVIVEYAAHPNAKLYVEAGDGTRQVVELAAISDANLIEVQPATRPVTVRVIDPSTRSKVPVRLHLHGQHGEYLPPRGHHRKVNPFWFEDHYAEFVNVHNQYCYIDGECIVDLPLGEVYVEVTRGYEIAPVRVRVEVAADTDTITLELERVLHWREKGWVTADTHVHFLSPQTALLEGQAEDVHVVNLLASQWGEMFSNVGDFDGRSTLGAKEFGGDGEFLVRVGTENRMQVLGHISLLGYAGAMIHPLCTGGPSESAIGDPLEVSMAEWAQRCIAQGGLVVMPHAPNPQLERAADVVLGLINAMELMTFNPLAPANIQINPYGIADWYRYLNLGYQVPVVGGSDKMSAASLLGGIRTYAHLGGREFGYENWMQAVRAGNTFVTVGPLASFQVEGVSPGGQIRLTNTGGTLNITWQVESASLPIDQVEVVMGGIVVDQVNCDKVLRASGSTTLKVNNSTWLALRVRGSYRGKQGEMAAHTSAVQVLVGDTPLFSPPDATLVLDQIQGAIAYVDTLAPRPEASRYKQLRATLETAYNQLHQRMHNAGAFHQHTPVHGHEDGH